MAIGNPAAAQATDALKQAKKRADDAIQDCQPYNELAEEIYRYILPMRRPSTDAKGQRLYAEIFDGTAPRAAFRFAGRLQSEFTPPFQQFWELKGGPAVNEGDEKKQLDEDLKQVSRTVRSQLNASNFDIESHSSYLDLLGGDGAILMLETGDKSNPTHYLAVPSTELAIRLDGWGRKAGIYWKRKFYWKDLPTLWKTVELSDKDRERIEKNPSDEVEIIQATEFEGGQWHFRAWHEHSTNFLHESASPYCNWLVFSFWKVPGEAKGRGPAAAALGTVKVVNKVQEFALKNAAFATLGLWMHRDDGAFRVANAPITPGAFWKVAQTGGPFGPSVAKIPMAERFDVSMFVLEQMQMAIKQAMLDDTLPPDNGAVRSATEIVERMKRLAADWAGAFSRLQRDLLRPLIEWNIWIAAKNSTLPASFKIDEQLIRLEIISPVARGDQAAAVENEVKWIELLTGLFGPQIAGMVARVEKIGPEWGRKLGVDENLIRSEAEAEKIQQAVAQIMAAQQTGQQQAA